MLEELGESDRYPEVAHRTAVRSRGLAVERDPYPNGSHRRTRLLTALGWDTSDPGLVTPEYNLSGERADYALLGTVGKASAFVEAKKLGESLAPHRMQMVNYANMSGVAYAGLTDGDRWELYTVFDQKASTRAPDIGHFHRQRPRVSVCTATLDALEAESGLRPTRHSKWNQFFCCPTGFATRYRLPRSRGPPITDGWTSR